MPAIIIFRAFSCTNQNKTKGRQVMAFYNSRLSEMVVDLRLSKYSIKSSFSPTLPGFTGFSHKTSTKVNLYECSQFLDSSLSHVSRTLFLLTNQIQCGLLSTHQNHGKIG